MVAWNGLTFRQVGNSVRGPTFMTHSNQTTTQFASTVLVGKAKKGAKCRLRIRHLRGVGGCVGNRLNRAAA